MRFRNFAIALLCLVFSGLSFGETLVSPHENVKINFKNSMFDVQLDGEKLIGPSNLGLQFQNQAPLGPMSVRQKFHTSNSAPYTQPFGKNSKVENKYEEYIFRLVEKNPPYRAIDLTFRIYDDGFGFRYTLPQQAAFKDFVLTEELTNIKLLQNPVLYGLPLSFNSSYEWYYRVGHLDKFGTWDLIALPLLLEYPSGKYVGITEANLSDYAGMYLQRSKTKKDTLETRLAPWPGQSEIKVKGSTPFTTPWRTFMIGNSAKTLVESNLVENLNEPSAIKDTSWIHPGKIQFPWWNGYYVPNSRPENPAGLNTWTLEHYIDFCAANGIENHSIDGFDKAWYGGPVDPFQAKDVVTPIPEINMPEVLNYAKSRGVGTRLWVHWAGISKDLDRALTTYESWGVEGIMVDFMNRDDQLAVRSYNDILRKTAEHHLTLTFHGVFKPTGQGRTYPHLLNHEAVLGTEYNKWSETGSTPEHEVQTAYVRMLAGPLDVHEGGFRPVPVDKYKLKWILPNTMGTLTRQLAMYVVYENHEPMLADYPETYEQNPLPFQFIKQVPVVWDQTLMVAGTVGKFISLARRKGQDWYLGSITDRDARSITLPLNFLEEGRYRAEIYSDTSDFERHPEAVELQTINVTAKDSISIQLAPAGGSAIRFHKL